MFLGRSSEKSPWHTSCSEQVHFFHMADGLLGIILYCIHGCSLFQGVMFRFHGQCLVPLTIKRPAQAVGNL